MITYDAKQLMELNSKFAKYQNAILPSLAKKALREAAQPMLRSARNLVPIGGQIAYKKGGSDQDRGGATRRDLRIQFVKVEGQEVARLLVGVSQKSGKVGWRTHFVTRGWTDRGGGKHRGKNFLQEAHDNTIEIVQDSFYKTLFAGLVKWGKENLPQ